VARRSPPGDLSRSVLETDSGQIAYDATMHLYWRMREAGGKLFYETSPDGSTWTVQHEVGTPAWASGGIVSFAAAAVSHTNSASVSFTDVE
jgi:hypothetical protein